MPRSLVGSHQDTKSLGQTRDKPVRASPFKSRFAGLYILGVSRKAAFTRFLHGARIAHPPQTRRVAPRATSNAAAPDSQIITTSRHCCVTAVPHIMQTTLGAGSLGDPEA